MKAFIKILKQTIVPTVVGLLVGSFVNYEIISLTSHMAPEGVDVSNIDSIRENIHKYTALHFLFPFLAHAIGTLIGALLAIKVSSPTNFRSAYIIAGFFFIGGLMMVFQLPSPLWFNILDLGLAYFPMAWIASRWLS